MLEGMGFNRDAATAALMATANNIERAADWLFSHMDDLDAAVARVRCEQQATAGGGRATASGAVAPATVRWVISDMLMKSYPRIVFSNC